MGRPQAWQDFAGRQALLPGKRDGGWLMVWTRRQGWPDLGGAGAVDKARFYA